MIVRTVPHADLLERDGEALLLTEGALLRLSAIGAAVVILASDGVDTADLAAALEDRFGVPEGVSTRAALDPVLDALAAQGVIELLADEAGTQR